MTVTNPGQHGPVAHGLGTTPRIIMPRYLCLADDNGFTAGQSIVMTAYTTNTPSGAVIWADATNINFRCSNIAGIIAVNATTGTNTALTVSKWALYVDLWG